jgi:hypothetical protein
MSIFADVFDTAFEIGGAAGLSRLWGGEIEESVDALHHIARCSTKALLTS